MKSKQISRSSIHDMSLPSFQRRGILTESLGSKEEQLELVQAKAQSGEFNYIINTKVSVQCTAFRQ